MPRYVEKKGVKVWDDLKAAIPKLKSAIIVGDEIQEFETTEPLTDTELATIRMQTGKTFEEV